MIAQPIAPSLSSGLSIPVSGMTCASCVGRVEKAIRGVAGVETAAVNLATGRATVSLSGGASVEPVLAAIRKAGYEPAEAEADFAVEGISCASCIARVEKAFRSVPGVLDVSANLATNRAHVRYAGGSATVSAMELA